EGQAEVTATALALFAFALLTVVLRTGVFVLELAPAFYALPVMAAAVACVQTSRTLARFDPDPARADWLRLGGLALSALAFALALTRPPGLSPVDSGNTLAVALMGLGLYASLLSREREPAYLYLTFGALVLAFFSLASVYYVVDLVHAVEEALRQAL